VGFFSEWENGLIEDVMIWDERGMDAWIMNGFIVDVNGWMDEWVGHCGTRGRGDDEIRGGEETS
jgi:hypothetical protein